METKNCLVVLGPTASGKTSLAVRLAKHFRGEILSVDSRQVYCGLDIGAGKDLSEYVDNERNAIPYHLIDVVDLDQEYNLFDFQRDFYRCFNKILGREMLPIAVGGTGLYLESILDSYQMAKVESDTPLREELKKYPTVDIQERLLRSKPNIHNTTDLLDRDRLIRAIEIAESEESPDELEAPEIRSITLGIQWDRQELKKRIGERLRKRLDQGMIAEVEGLHARGVSWERLERLGLEYRYVSEFIQGKTKSENDLFQKLHSAINRFAKRQMTWFRRMERKGMIIHWVPEGSLDRALEILEPIAWTVDSKSIS